MHSLHFILHNLPFHCYDMSGFPINATWILISTCIKCIITNTTIRFNGKYTYINTIYECVCNSAFVIFRCIKPQLKSFALGIYTLAIRVLGKYNLCFKCGSHHKCILNTSLSIFTELLLCITKWRRWLGLYYFYFLLPFISSFPPFFTDFSLLLFQKYLLRANTVLML